MKTAETKLKRLFTHDWEAKLICLVLAMLLWWVVQDQIQRANPTNTNQPTPQLYDGWPGIPKPDPTPAPAPAPTPSPGVPSIPGITR